MMNPRIALATLFISACAASSTEVSNTPPRPRPTTPDPCAIVRPDFGGAATEADRNLFAYDVSAPLDLRKTVESTNDGVEVSTISFRSPDSGSVTGLLFDPVGRSSLRPGIVLMHGMPGTARSMAAEAQRLAQFGAVVIAIDAPFTRRGGSLQFTVQDRAEQIQLIKDLQRAVDVLRARANVDDDRIAYLGISYGGAIGALFAGIERRIKAAVLVVGDGGLVSHFTGPEDFAFMASLSCATRVDWFAAMSPIEPIRFIPHASNTALLLQNGTLDALVPGADASALHAAAPDSKTLRWYVAGHGLNQQAVFDRHDWLHERIGLDAR
jgi:dienelactone hydrolase